MPQDPADNRQIVDALRKVALPGFSRDIVSFGFVKGVEVAGSDVRIDVQLSGTAKDKEGVLSQAIRNEVGKLPGIESVEVRFGQAPAAPAPGSWW